MPAVMLTLVLLAGFVAVALLRLVAAIFSVVLTLSGAAFAVWLIRGGR